MERLKYIVLNHFLDGHDIEPDDWHEYDVSAQEFFDNEKVIDMYLKYVANFFHISEEAAGEILNYYDAFAEKDMVEAFVEEHNEELDEIFWSYDYIDPDNVYQ